MYDWFKVHYGENGARAAAKADKAARKMERKREKDVRKAEKAAKKERQREADRVISCTIWSVETQHKSSAGRAAAGALVFGLKGAIVGAASAHDKTFTTFRVEYQGGRVEFPRCENGGMLYQMYISLAQQYERGAL